MTAESVVVAADPAGGAAEQMPAIYLGHGAPPLLDDPVWSGQLRTWATTLPRPKSILIVSAHWESAPITLGATTQVPLTYDFYGFPRRYYEQRYDAPGAPQWSMEFDRWATEALERRDIDSLFDFRNRAPGMPYAHPTVEHFAPLFVALGAATDPNETPDSAIEGYWYGLSKRSFQMR